MSLPTKKQQKSLDKIISGGPCGVVHGCSHARCKQLCVALPTELRDYDIFLLEKSLSRARDSPESAMKEAELKARLLSWRALRVSNPRHEA